MKKHHFFVGEALRRLKNINLAAMEKITMSVGSTLFWGV